MRSFYELITWRGRRDGPRWELTGSYDIRGRSLVGWVERIPFLSNAGTKVRAIRGGDIIAECKALEDGKTERMPFLLELSDNFTAEDLAREDVLIFACNRRGDSGKILLNGATRIDLIREYLGVPVDPILELDFSSGGNARSYLGRGWAQTEEQFTWTLDEDSLVHLKAPVAPGIYYLRMRFGAFVAPFAQTQPMEIFLDERAIGAFSENQHEQQFREFRFELSDTTHRAPTLRFHHPSAARPIDNMAGNDGRRLAFNFRKLTLVRERPE